MSAILIPTAADDAHAQAVALVLQEMGHQPMLWHCADLPERATASAAIEPGRHDDLRLTGVELNVDLDQLDVFWHRRVGQAVVTAAVPACDRDIAVNESNRLIRGLLAQASRRAWAVNSFGAAHRAEDKLLQLTSARELGLEVPRTLISNDPQRIRAFVARHEQSGVVCKNFTPIAWLSEGPMAMNYTARVTLAMLPRDGILRLAPVIWQAAVPKDHEVRVNCMGEELVAAALHSQDKASARDDWRRASCDALRVQPTTVPPSVAAACRALMQRLDLRFGCFDFIVTPDGRWVFLEINQMGQFLWIEQVQPKIPMLQMFCDFIVSRDNGFRWRRRGEVRTLAEVEPEVVQRLAGARQRHVMPAIGAHIYREDAPSTALSAATADTAVAQYQAATAVTEATHGP